jgi:hypothetical protein
MKCSNLYQCRLTMYIIVMCEVLRNGDECERG